MDAVGVAELMVVAAIIIFSAAVTAQVYSLKVWPFSRILNSAATKAENDKLMKNLMSDGRSTGER